MHVVKAALDRLLVQLEDLAAAVTVTLITQCLIKQEVALVAKATLVVLVLLVVAAVAAVLAPMAAMALQAAAVEPVLQMHMPLDQMFSTAAAVAAAGAMAALGQAQVDRVLVAMVELVLGQHLLLVGLP